MIKRIARSLRARFFRTNESGWYLRQLDNGTDADNAVTLPPGMTLKILSREDRELMYRWLIDHREIYPWVYFPEEIRSAQRHDHWYPVVLRGEEIVAFLKLARNQAYIHDFETEVRLPERVAFIYDTFVEPGLRGAGLARSLIGAVSNWLIRLGYGAVYCHIEDRNLASIKAFTHAGFKRVGSVRYIRLTFFRWWVISGSSRGGHGLTQWLEAEAFDGQQNQLVGTRSSV